MYTAYHIDLDVLLAFTPCSIHGNINVHVIKIKTVAATNKTFTVCTFFQ